MPEVLQALLIALAGGVATWIVQSMQNHKRLQALDIDARERSQRQAADCEDALTVLRKEKSLLAGEIAFLRPRAAEAALLETQVKSLQTFLVEMQVNRLHSKESQIITEDIDIF